jgi:soluble lytic murein transglycosylase-like protein
MVSAATPPAIVRELSADEDALRTATGTRFVEVARERQTAIRALGRTPGVAMAVVKLRPAERDDVLARFDLERLSTKTPRLRARLRIAPAAPQARLEAWYREAEQRFGVRWQLLAAVNFVESDFNRLRNTSVAGAQGPMQFEPATWREYGLGGNVHDPRDAILGAANYLRASGARTNERDALLHYNHSSLYVDAVLRYAHRLATVPTAFAEYYAWKLIVRR